MRVLVTGANGYLGGAVCSAALAEGHEVVGLTHKGRTAVPEGVTVRTADIRDVPELVKALDGVEAVCHLAGLTRARDSHTEPLRYFEVNVAGTLALLRAMSATGVRRLVFASTAAIHGTPDRLPVTEDTPDAPPHPYAASKQAAESAIAAQAATGELTATVLRLFSVVGGDRAGDETGIIARLMAVAAGELPRLPVNGDGSVVRDFLHLDDAARAFTCALSARTDPGLRRYTIASGVGTSLHQLIAATTRVTGRPIPLEYRPAAVESQRLVGDSARARAELGWWPTRSGIESVLTHAWAHRPSA